MANIFHFPTLWVGRGTYAARRELRKLGGRWSEASRGWWLPPLSMVERQLAEQLRYRWRREIMVTPLLPGSPPPESPLEFSSLRMAKIAPDNTSDTSSLAPSQQRGTDTLKAEI